MTTDTSASDEQDIHGQSCPCLCCYQSGSEIDVSNPDVGAVGTVAGNGMPIWSAYQTAAHIVRPSGTWARGEDDLVITYTFSDEANIGNGFEVYTEAEREGARYAMDLYADVSGATFVESETIADADITYRFIEGRIYGGGWANYPTSSGVTTNIGHVNWEPEILPGTYIMRLQLHELGHSMGLAHPGNYNGGGSSYADADHWNDSRQFTNMSYWGEENTGASFGHMATLGLHDILATQIEYGINWETRNTDTTYGYNSTAELASYDLTTRNDIAFSIWDGGGEDTIDFSGSRQGTELDLREGSFSSVNGQTYNVSIAYGAIIENGIGSASDDTIIGNTVGNILVGGAGNDTITGGLTERPDFLPDSRHFTGIGLNLDPLENDQYISVAGIDAFSGDAFTLEMMVDIVRMSTGETVLASYATSASSNTVLIDASSGGDIGITIAGAKISTGIALASIVDGQPHRLSVSWEKASGALSMYIDGTSVFTGTHRAGTTVEAGGTLVFGQEQDSVGGRFSASQTLQGTIGDIRIFDTVRTDNEIEAAAFRSVATDKAGLVHNWRVTDDTDGTISDVSTGGPGTANLTDLLRGSFTAAQSSTWYDSTSWSADKVLDGNLSSFSHTGRGSVVDQWLTLDFGRTLDLTSIEIVNRDSQGERLDGAVVSLLGADGSVLHSFAPITGAEDSETFTLTVPAGLAAASLRIDNDDEDYLQIAEIDLFGRVPDGMDVHAMTIHGGATVRDTTPPIDRTPDNDHLKGGDGDDTLDGGWGHDVLEGQAGSDTLIGGEGNDLLIGSYGSVRYDTMISGTSVDLTESVSITATQGSTWSNDTGRYGAQKAIDGNLSTFNHTLETPRWMEFDLGGTYTIDEVVLHNRAGYEQRLEDAVVTLHDASGAIIHSFDAITSPGSVVTLTLDTAIMAQTVRIADSDGHLHLTEVDIFGINSDAAGYDGSNVIMGGAGNDRIRGGAGADTLDGGVGIDTLQYTSSSTGVTVDLNADAVTGLQSASGGDAQGDVISGFEHVTGSQANDDLTGDVGLNLLFGMGGDDTIDGGAGNDRIRGGAGADTMNGGDGYDWLQYGDSTGGVGVDLMTGIGTGGDAAGDSFSDFEMVVGSRFADTLTGNDATNYLYGLAGDDSIAGGNGNDHVRGGNGADTLDGGAGRDFVDYAGSAVGVAINLATGSAHGGSATGDVISGFERIRGSQFNDRLTGDDQGNILRGLHGNDVIEGRAGNDHLDGANGADRFIFRAGDGTDTILNYEHDRDMLQLHGMTFDDLDIRTTSRGAEVDYGAGDTIRILSITDSSVVLTEDDFIFI